MRLKTIGEIRELSLDTSERTAGATVALRGEPREVELHVRKYALDERAGQAGLTLLEADASPERLDALL